MPQTYLETAQRNKAYYVSYISHAKMYELLVLLAAEIVKQCRYNAQLVR